MEKETVGAPSNNIQLKRTFQASKTVAGVRADDLTNAEARGNCFAPSVEERILDKQPGFGAVRKSINNQATNGGRETLKSDSRVQGSPLPEDGASLNIHGRRRDEHAIGRSMDDVNDDNTVFGEDLGANTTNKKPENRDIAKSKIQGRQDKVGSPGKKPR